MLGNFIGKYIAQPVYAQDSLLGLVDVAARLLNVLILISSGVFVGFVILAAFKFATAAGDPKGIQGAKQSLTYAVIGLCVVVGVFAINAIVVGVLAPTRSDSLIAPDALFLSIKGALEDIMDYAGIVNY
jgi:hypothetical protein